VDNIEKDFSKKICDDVKWINDSHVQLFGKEQAL